MEDFVEEEKPKRKRRTKAEIEATKEPKKVETKTVRMYHVNNSVIDIEERLVEAHLKTGWRLEK